MAMSEIKRKRIKEAMKAHLCRLVERNDSAYFEAYEEALEAHGDVGEKGKRKFTFNLGFGVRLSPADENQIDMDSDLSFNVKHKDKVHDTVRTDKDLADVGIEAAEAEQRMAAQADEDEVEFIDDDDSPDMASVVDLDDAAIDAQEAAESETASKATGKTGGRAKRATGGRKAASKGN